MHKVLIVEDDPLIAELEKDYLEVSNFKVDIVADGQKAVEMALTDNYDLCIIDIMLPGLQGYEVCKTIRQHKNMPIIFVSAKKDDIDKIKGLSFGANDYVVKPFSPSVLIAKIKSQIAYYERLISQSHKSSNCITINDLKIYHESRRVYLDTAEVTLTNKEYELLYFLASNPNIVFSKDTLFDRIWGLDAVGDTSTVVVHINRIREKVEADASNPQYIETVWGAGYRFTL